MSLLKLAYKNIFEPAASTVSLKSGTAESIYPLYRLYDRDIGRIFKSTAAETIIIHVDQGAAPIAIDRLWIPMGHNLNGQTLDLEWSDNDSAWTPAVTQWVQGDALAISKEWASITHRYWRFTITTPAAAVQIPELILAPTYEFEKQHARPLNNLDEMLNVTNLKTSAGQDRFLKHGDPKRRRQYIFRLVTEAQKVNLDAFYDYYGGTKPFLLVDDTDIIIFGKLATPLNLNKYTSSKYEFNFDFIEVLP